MAKKTIDEEYMPIDAIPTAMTDEAREKQMVALAYNAAEERIRNGTASAQEIVHFLKIGSQREKLERENLELQQELMKAKTEALKAQTSNEELVRNALEVFKLYAGHEDE